MPCWEEGGGLSSRSFFSLSFFPSFLLGPDPLHLSSPLLSTSQGLLYIRQYILVMSSRILFRAVTASPRASSTSTCLFHTQLHSLSTSVRPTRTWTGIGTQSWNNHKALINIQSSSSSSMMNQFAPFSTGSVLNHGALPRPAPGTGCKVNFITREGETVTVEANEGESLLDVARANDLDVEGACEASLACSTCHLILDEASFDKLEEPSDEENDMLDLAFGLSDTSRLGCQVLMTKELSGLTAKIPSATRNMYVDGAKPKHH